jgi:hypothetical protein
MNDQRASRSRKALGRARNATRRSAAAWEPRVGSPACGSRRWLRSSPAKGRRRNAGRLLRDGRQSRLNTTDASQPVMTAIMAVTTP